MQRMGMMIGLASEHIPEYKRLHADVLTEVLKQIKQSNIRNYTIFLREPENILFGTWEYHGTDFESHSPAGHPRRRRVVGHDGRGLPHRLTGRVRPPHPAPPARSQSPLSATHTAPDMHQRVGGLKHHVLCRKARPPKPFAYFPQHPEFRAARGSREGDKICWTGFGARCGTSGSATSGPP